MDTLLKVLKLSEMLQNMCSMRKKAGVYIFLINHLFSPSLDFFKTKNHGYTFIPHLFPLHLFFLFFPLQFFPRAIYPHPPWDLFIFEENDLFMMITGGKYVKP